MSRGRLILLIQLIFFIVWGGWLLRYQTTGVGIWLETQPVDPRDYLSGNYIALRYKIQDPQAELCKLLKTVERPVIWVRLSPAQTVVLENGERQVYSELDMCSLGEPPQSMRTGSGVWARGRVTPNPWGGATRLEFDIERYFVSEADPLRSLTSGSVAARVSVDENGHLHIQELRRVLPKIVRHL